MPVIHNAVVAPLLRHNYSLAQLADLENLLETQGTFDFMRPDNGLFPATNVRQSAEYTGYRYVWVRNNVHVACAHHLRERCPGRS
jgi:phosphorylase kinase alpha/beta subunit